MKKILALILALSMLFVFTACGDNEDSTQPYPTEPKPTEETTVADDDYFYDEPTEYEPETTPISEWGFYDISEMEGLVKITGVNLNKGYVFYTGSWVSDPEIIKFSNGNAIDCYVDEEKDSNYNVISYKIRTKSSCKYTIIDNNNLRFGNYSTITIEERNFYDGYNFICFETNDGWYVPYSILDCENIENYDEHEKQDTLDYAYKIYLKQ